MQKWGTHKSGTSRFRCPSCGLNGVRERDDLTRKYRRQLYQKWLLSKLTLSDFGAEYRVTRRTLDRWFSPFRDEEIIPNRHLTQSDVFIIDGYYVEYGATILIAQNPRNQVVSWHFTYTENSSTWLTFLNSISTFPLAIVCDGNEWTFNNYLILTIL